MYKPIIIGGCGSTGSSLLRQVLNRHSGIYIAPETHVFCKHRLYHDFENAKLNISKKSFFGLRDTGLQMFTGFDLRQSEFNEIDRMYFKYNTFKDLAHSIFESVMLRREKKVWGEKTPGNIYHFQDIANALGDVHLIWMLRNPYDTIASLVRRGYSVTHAACRYLLTYAFGMKMRDSLEICHYESLVQYPEKTLRSLLSKQSMDFEPDMLNPGKSSLDDGTKMIGWELDEAAKISPHARGGFFKMTTAEQKSIHSAMVYLSLNEHFTAMYGLPISTFYDVFSTSLYSPITFDNGRLDRAFIKRELFIMKMRRILKLYPPPFAIEPFSVK